MINIRRILLVSSLFTVFFITEGMGQKINQFDQNGKRTGIWKKTYENGTVRYTGQFKNGKEVGVFKFYSRTAPKIPAAIKEYTVANDTAKVSFFNGTGKLTSKGFLLGKKRVGKWTFYAADGRKVSEEQYRDGQLDGPIVIFYPNGKVTEKTFYKAGQKHGNSKIYTDAGVLLEDVNYRNGKLDGKGTYYNLKGQLKERGNYKEGKRIGKWEFYMDGELSKKKKERLSDYGK